MKILKSKFYLFNVVTKKAYTKPFNTAREGFKEIETEHQTKQGFIVVEIIKGFENVNCVRLSKYPNTLKKTVFVDDIEQLKGGLKWK